MQAMEDLGSPDMACDLRDCERSDVPCSFLKPSGLLLGHGGNLGTLAGGIGTPDYREAYSEESGLLVWKGNVVIKYQLGRWHVRRISLYSLNMSRKGDMVVPMEGCL
jgi:hypothetical protein